MRKSHSVALGLLSTLTARYKRILSWVEMTTTATKPSPTSCDAEDGAAAVASRASCTDCGKKLRRNWWAFWDSEVGRSCEGGEDCQAVLCKACHNMHPLLAVDDTSNDVTDKNDLSRAKAKKLCTGCFRKHSTLDFEHTYTKISGDSDTTFVFVHGGGACRELFRGHAEELKQRYGHGSILLDLPGHGSLVETILTLESCCSTVSCVLKECGLIDDRSNSKSENKIIYIGGSLGAYVGFYILDNMKDIFDGAILIDCGQNVGPGASLKARMGLVFLDWLGSSYSNASIMNMMLGVLKKSKADYKLVETCYGAGTFFDQTHQQVECLRTVSPASHIPKLKFPILFMNGGDDYRDSEGGWLDLCVNDNTELKVYDGGDHFFTHDRRFLGDILERMDAFAKKL